MDNIKFFLDNPNSVKTSIKLKFDYKGKRFVFGTGISINPKLWDTESHRPTQSKKLIKEFLKDVPQLDTILKNNTTSLNNYESKIKELEKNSIDANTQFDFDVLKSKLTELKNELKPNKTPKQKENPQAAPETPQAPFIKDLIYEYIKGMYSGKKKTKQKNNYDNETIKAYLSFKKMWDELESYFDKQYIVTDISLDFETELYEFFNDAKEYTPNYKGKLIKMLKCIVNDFIKFEYEKVYKSRKAGVETVLSEIDLLYIEKQLNRIIKPNSKPVNIALDENELQSIYELNLSDKPHLDRARDIFLTGCYTGLRHSDYSRIRPEHINNQFIQIIPIKTKEDVNIKIIPELIKIINKWNYTIPEMTSQELGRYIKEIGCLAGITKNVEIKETKGNQTKITTKPKNQMITTHTARRSFATNMFYDGMNPIDIMKITGHKKLETFQKYIVQDPNRELLRQEKNRISNERYLKVV